MVWIWVLTALAADASLAIERGRAALDAEQFAQATDFARAAIDQDELSIEAYSLYLDTAAATGTTEAALGDLSTLAASGDDALQVVSGWAHAAYSERSWLPLDHPGPYQALQAQLLAKLEHAPTPTQPWSAPKRRELKHRVQGHDLVGLYVLRRHALAAGDAPALVALNGALARFERGFDLPDHPHWSPKQIEQIARRVRAEGAGALPEGRPSERQAIALRLAQLGDDAIALGVLALVRAQADSPALALANARIRAQRDGIAALPALNQAVHLACGPSPRDHARTDRQAWAADISAALVLRGETLSLAGEHRRALVDLLLATQLVRAHAGAKATLHSRLASRGMPSLSKTYGAVPLEGALRRAVREAEDADWSGVLTAASDALWVMAYDQQASKRVVPVPWSSDIAMAEALRARAQWELDQHDDALESATISALLQPTGRPERAALRARLYEEAGATTLAFDAWSLAWGYGLDVDDAMIRTWDGLSGPYGAAAKVLAWFAALPKPNDLSLIQASWQRAERSGKILRLDATRKGPILGARAPDKAVTVGEVTVLSFYRSDTAASVQQLRRISWLLRTLSREGIKIQGIGVAIEPDEQRFKLGQERMDAPAVGLFWSPAMGEVWDVQTVPTTWVVDRHGTLRYLHIGYTGAWQQMERQLRTLAAEP